MYENIKENIRDTKEEESTTLRKSFKILMRL